MIQNHVLKIEDCILSFEFLIMSFELINIRENQCQSVDKKNNV